MFFESKFMNRLKVKEKIYRMQNSNEKKDEVAVLISDKVDIRSRNITEKVEEHCIMRKGSIHQEYMTVINVNTPNRKSERTKR